MQRATVFVSLTLGICQACYGVGVMHRIDAPSGSFPRALALSADGSVVVGEYQPTSNIVRPFVFRLDQAAQTIPGLEGVTDARATGISGDGSVIVGWADSIGYRWTPAGPQALGFLPGGTYVSPMGVSADGSAITGYGNTGASSWPQAFRWTPAGMQSLGSLPMHPESHGFAISADGSTVVGELGVAGAPFRWTQASGMQTLGSAPDGHNLSAAVAVSADGSVVVGSTQMGLVAQYVGYRWTASTGAQFIPPLSDGLNAPLAISADGNAVVGESSRGAFLWTPSLGTVELRSYLSAQGVDMTNWDLAGATAISLDRTAICGFGSYQVSPFAFVRTSWVVTGLAPLPSPASGAFVLASCWLARRRRR